MERLRPEIPILGMCIQSTRTPPLSVHEALIVKTRLMQLIVILKELNVSCKLVVVQLNFLYADYKIRSSISSIKFISFEV
jgi:hypothetical protein